MEDTERRLFHLTTGALHCGCYARATPVLRGFLTEWRVLTAAEAGVPPEGGAA
jgi:hypothetical protein